MSDPIRAAGYVLFRRAPDGWRYLLLRHTGPGGWWSPPKGHAKRGESARETARRETIEESSLDPGDGHPWFIRHNEYVVKRGPKRVTYFAAEAPSGECELSDEHDDAGWFTLDEALDTITHDSLREVMGDAATFLKDPTLRRGLSPSGARAMLERHVDDETIRHTALVASMARALAEAWPGLDPEFVEACAWLHDIGKAHGRPCHPITGYQMVRDAGHPGYAPTCISHWSKGRPRPSFPDDADEIFHACDLLTFEPHEKVVALADLMATGERRVTIEEAYEDQIARLGPSKFSDETLAIGLGLRAEFERVSGRTLDETVRPPA